MAPGRRSNAGCGKEFVVGGWRQSDAEGRTLSSLLVDYYDSKGRLIFAGKLGTGYTAKIERDLLAQLAKLGPRRKDKPAREVQLEIAIGFEQGLKK
jgi:ATP-dependent DNA ligase